MQAMAVTEITARAVLKTTTRAVRLEPSLDIGNLGETAGTAIDTTGGYKPVIYRSERVLEPDAGWKEAGAPRHPHPSRQEALHDRPGTCAAE